MVSNSETAREIAALEEVERKIRRGRRRERIQQVIIGVLGAMLVATAVKEYGCPFSKKR
ncbi:MAG: hypothetical protein HDT06_06420 [Bacteroidales bacterium]|nr:hypothetical protein [Bacteroidales bacterium]MBD5216231.1 hypothetical protein [Bacteroidales bacterium]MBD5219335.1 hypothetical protein [Bacteroidales bacterium]